MNSLGTLYNIMCWGESHGQALGVVIDGCPAGLNLTGEELSGFLQKNDRPLSVLATGRIEPNNVEIMAGTHNGITLGTPISLVIKNENVRTNDYDNLQKVFRPGHGDYTYYMKHKRVSPTGGGRASGRECVTRLAAGYIAEKVIKHYLKDFSIKTRLTMLAGVKIRDKQSFKRAVDKARQIAAAGDSSGGMVRVKVTGLIAGLGEPVFGGIDAQLSRALMSIGAVKSVEIGHAKGASHIEGSKFNDDFCKKGFKVGFTGNNNGGVLSGITTGSDLIATISVKPTPSIGLVKKGLGLDKKLHDVKVSGRHDKNITPRIGPIARAMTAITLVDHLMLRGVINRDFLA